MADFSEQIKSWVQLDNKVKTLHEELKNIRGKRNDIGTNIYKYATDNNLEHAVIQISDGKLKFQNTRSTQALTLKFIKECLDECLGNSVDTNEIMEFIKSKREIKYTNDIKRYYD